MTGNKLESLESLAATSLTLDVDDYTSVPSVFRQTSMLEMTISGFEEEEEEGKPHNLDVITELILSSNQISRFASDHLPTRYDKIRKSGQFKAAFSPISEGLINYLQAQGVCSGRQSTEKVDRKGDRYTPQLHQAS